MNISTQGWLDFAVAQPIDPRTVLASATLGSTVGTFKRSTTFLQSLWGTNTIAFTGVNSQLISLNTTDASTVALAAQWTMAHRMTVAGVSVSPSITKIAFAKSGLQWDNQFEIALGATNWTDVQLSLRDNLGTSGVFAASASGSVPVIFFTGTQTGTLTLHLTFATSGNYSMVLLVSTGGTYSTFEMEFVVM